MFFWEQKPNDSNIQSTGVRKSHDYNNKNSTSPGTFSPFTSLDLVIISKTSISPFRFTPKRPSARKIIKKLLEWDWRGFYEFSMSPEVELRLKLKSQSSTQVEDEKSSNETQLCDAIGDEWNLLPLFTMMFYFLMNLSALISISMVSFHFSFFF